jgi:hypothetical protein
VTDGLTGGSEDGGDLDNERDGEIKGGTTSREMVSTRTRITMRMAWQKATTIPSPSLLTSKSR